MIQSKKIIEIHVPEYNLEREPNYIEIGKKVDLEIEKKLPEGKYIYRAIGKDDHPNFSLNELVEIILELGTDKYDPKRKEICFDEFCNYDHDIQAGSFEIKNKKLILDNSFEYSSLFGDTMKKFYKNVMFDRGYRVRIDIILVYDANKLVKAEKINFNLKGVRLELEECLYKFKNPKNKKDSLVAIVKILR